MMMGINVKRRHRNYLRRAVEAEAKIDALRAALDEAERALRELWKACAAPEWGGDHALRRYYEAGTKTQAALARIREVKRDG